MVAPLQCLGFSIPAQLGEQARTSAVFLRCFHGALEVLSRCFASAVKVCRYCAQATAEDFMLASCLWQLFMAAIV